MNTQLEVNKVLSRKLWTTKHTQCLTVSTFNLVQPQTHLIIKNDCFNFPERQAQPPRPGNI